MGKLDVRLSPKHGVNPTIPQCAVCGADRQEVALLGLLPDDERAPHKCVIDGEPCDKCKRAMAEGVLFVECNPFPEPWTIVASIPHRTGRIWHVPEAGVRHVLKDESAARALAKRLVFIEPGEAEAIGFYRTKGVWSDGENKT